VPNDVVMREASGLRAVDRRFSRHRKKHPSTGKHPLVEADHFPNFFRVNTAGKTPRWTTPGGRNTVGA